MRGKKRGLRAEEGFISNVCCQPHHHPDVCTNRKSVYSLYTFYMNMPIVTICKDILKCTLKHIFYFKNTTLIGPHLHFLTTQLYIGLSTSLKTCNFPKVKFKQSILFFAGIRTKHNISMPLLKSYNFKQSPENSLLMLQFLLT